MRKQKLNNHEDEAFEQYLQAIGAFIEDISKQAEEVE